MVSPSHNARPRRGRKLGATVGGALLGLLSAGIAPGEGPIPWPGGAAPLATELDALAAAADELFVLERFEELLEAHEKGEDTQHIFMQQAAIDAGVHDIDRLFLAGDAAFEHEFRDENGYGDADGVRLFRVHRGLYGGLDGFSCNGCHSQGGVNGAGDAPTKAFYFGDGDHLSSAVQRIPPQVIGLGFVQALAAEMSAELQQQVRDGITAAKELGEAVPVPLVSNGVSFGFATAYPVGAPTFEGLEGVDRDLVIKPFGWKGHTARLRRFAERAARVHFGVQSHVLALGYQEAPNAQVLGPGPNWWDPDDDGVQREIEEGLLTAFGVYLALLESPVILPPYDPGLRERWARGSELFDEIGCSDCHRRALALDNAFWEEHPDTTGGPPVVLNLIADGEAPRGIDNAGDITLFSDLKRHDMGDNLADKVDDPDGIGRRMFLTRPLWGLAERPPYLHDGRAPTIPDAILEHDGEAAEQRAAFAALDDDAKKDLHVFLLSLSRQPKLRVER